MPSILILLYFGVLIEQLYALNYQFPQPDGGIRYPGRHTSLIVCSLGCAVSTLPYPAGEREPSALKPAGSDSSSLLPLLALLLLLDGENNTTASVQRDVRRSNSGVCPYAWSLRIHETPDVCVLHSRLARRYSYVYW